MALGGGRPSLDPHEIIPRFPSSHQQRSLLHQSPDGKKTREGADGTYELTYTSYPVTVDVTCFFLITHWKGESDRSLDCFFQESWKESN